MLVDDNKGKMNESIISRFSRKIDRPDTRGCWNWKRAKNKKGYGVFRTADGTVLAHRLQWMMTNGRIPEGIKVLHTCDNPACVNPAHLFLGTDDDNSKDMIKKGRQRKGSSHGRCKLNEDQVRQIRFMHQNGARQKELVQKFGVAQQTISHVLCHDYWKHI